MKKLFLLDAMALIYRAYYSMVRSPRITSKGLNTSAVYGFTNTLYELLKSEKPTHIAVSFDTGAPTLRHADFAAYKANRESTPDDIITSIPYIKEILKAFKIPIILKDGYEADDVIGTLAKKAEMEGFQVYMMTSDKDYGQLVSENIFMYKPGKFGQKAEVVGIKEICEKYSIEHPVELIDILGLWGDASDNIPGVPNIGEVKAKKLIAQFHSIENLYKNIDQVDNQKLKETLIEHQDKAMISKSLATIMLDVPVEYNFEEMKLEQPDSEKLKKIFNELEFRTLSQRVFTDLSLQNKIKPTVPDLFSSQEEPISETIEHPFSRFKDKTHHFVEINDPQTLDHNILHAERLFFEWIYVNEKIAGFVFSNTIETIYYHILENTERHYVSLFKTIFEKEKEIVSFQVKGTFKLFKLLKINNKTRLFDLQIAHYLLQPENSHQLERLTENYLTYELLPQETETTLEKIIQSTCEKVEVYQLLYSIFVEDLRKSNLIDLFENLEMPLTEVLADMELNGIKLDPIVLAESSEIMAAELKEIETQIYQYAGTTFNIGSPKQMGEVLFEKLKIIENAKLTKTKQYQTGEEILVKLTHKHPIVPLILEWRSLSKLKSTYIDALPQLIHPKTGKIHTTFQQTTTSTGRLSSINPNIQNIPIRSDRGKEIRKAFIASSEDHWLVSADYSQIELRVVASVSEDQNMIQAFLNHEDIHTATAAQVFHLPGNQVTAEQRRYAKTVNFGILYGISAFGLSERLHIPQVEARQLISDYNKSFPKIEAYMEGILEFARKTGYVETLLGRRRYIRDIRSSNGILRKAAERNAINAPIQGTAADIIKVAMIHIFKELNDKNLKTKMVLQVHDELIFDVPQDELPVVMEMIPRLMNQAMNLKVPLEVEINSGKSWFDAH
ncbi:MAG TPA: DNA polymerase I [Bacteroidales bacterium]|nr:DNA polymerase I [Bacteroidales bacterium]